MQGIFNRNTMPDKDSCACIASAAVSSEDVKTIYNKF